MPADRELQEQWARAIEGEPLTAAELDRLREDAERDAETKADWLADARMDGWLRGLAWDRQDGDAWSARLADRLRTERDGDAFTARVALRIRRRRMRGRQIAFAMVAAVAVALAFTTWSPHAFRRSPKLAPPSLTNQAAIERRPEAIAPIPRSSAVVAPAGPPVPLLRFDFESGERKPPMLDVPVRDCPPRGESRYCLRARRYSEGHKEIVGVRFEDRARGLFVHRPGVKLSFDYWVGSWVGASAPGITVWVNDATQDAPYFLSVDDLDPVGWTRVEASLSDFQPQHPAPGVQGIRDGDRIDFLLIQTRYSRQDVLFVDDVAIVGVP